MSVRHIFGKNLVEEFSVLEDEFFGWIVRVHQLNHSQIEINCSIPGETNQVSNIQYQKVIEMHRVI